MTVFKPGSAVFALVVAGAAALVASDQGTRPWPPPLQTVSADSPVLSPADSMAKIAMPPGYRLELVVSEPMIQDPVVIDFDPDGRMWAIEMVGYMQDMPATTEHEPSGRIVVLEDTNDDGKMDKRTVFLDRLVLPRSLKVLDHGVLIAEPPNLWLARDTNGDLKADTKDLVTNTYGRLDANVEHNANGLFWALDNWMYTSEHDGFLRLKDGKFELKKTIARGQWGVTQDDAGRIYRNTNSAALSVDYLPAPALLRNPNLVRTRGSYESVADEVANSVYPMRPTRGVNRGYQDGILRPDGTLAAFTAAAAPTIYRGDRLPSELYGNVFIAEPSANLVSRLALNDTGSGIKATRAYEKGEFIASTDERFRPVNLFSAPDGTLYVVDIYRGIIQHRGYITEYLRDHIVANKLELPTGLGRVYRVVHTSTKRDARPAMSKATPAQLVQRLSHPNGWWRDTAQRLLVERGAPGVQASLKQLAESGKDVRARLHALWILDGVDRLEPSTVTLALNDPSRDIRLSAVRLAERWLSAPSHPIQAAVEARIDDADWAVRRQLAASLGELPAGKREPAIAALIRKHGDDPIVLDAALSGLTGMEPAVLKTLLQAPAETPQVAAGITMLTATIVRGAQDPPVQDVFDLVARDATPMWQRSALLRGAEGALLGPAFLTGGGGRGRGAGAGRAGGDPNAPGQRGEPRGASAFPARGRAAGAGGAQAAPPAETPAPAPAGGGRGGGGGPALKLSREPALVGFAARDRGELGTRATALLARVEWPGKPGAAPAATPLTAAEQQRFAAGREVYQSLCIACHQADGRGLEKIAPSLIGSQLALAPPTITARILVNGKEGPTGLMPPLGGVLNDDQMAAVLTYIHREWGHTAAPVTSAEVAAVRKATETRTRPWTNDELLKLLGGGSR